MVGAVHDEADAGGDRHVAADHEAIAEEVVVMEDAGVLEPLRLDGIVVVGEIADDDVRAIDDGLQKDHAGVAGKGVPDHGIGMGGSRRRHDGISRRRWTTIEERTPPDAGEAR